MADDAVTPDVRDRLALALDFDDLVPALRMARELAPFFGTMKVGLELYSAAGPEAITTLIDLGVDVFADLKLHDIPTTVGRAAQPWCGPGWRACGRVRRAPARPSPCRSGSRS